MVPAASDRISPVPSYSGDPTTRARLRLQACHLLWGGFPVRFVFAGPRLCGPYNPLRQQRCRRVWAPPGSLAATWGITCLFSVPGGTEMFQFPPLAFLSRRNTLTTTLPEWVAPFGDPRINTWVQLPAAFRSFTRPSSPDHA